jgi:hypothetical protein
MVFFRLSLHFSNIVLFCFVLNGSRYSLVFDICLAVKSHRSLIVQKNKNNKNIFFPIFCAKITATFPVKKKDDNDVFCRMKFFR